MFYKEFQTSSSEQISFESELIVQHVKYQVFHTNEAFGTAITKYIFDEENYVLADNIEIKIMNELGKVEKRPIEKTYTFFMGILVILFIIHLIYEFIQSLDF